MAADVVQDADVYDQVVSRVAGAVQKTGISKKLKSELRFQLIDSLRRGAQQRPVAGQNDAGRIDAAPFAAPPALAERAIFSLVLEFLRSHEKLYSLSVLLPECGMTAADVLSEDEAGQVLSLQRVPCLAACLGQGVSETPAQPLLQRLLAQLATLREPLKTTQGVQTDGAGVGCDLDAKLQACESPMEAALARDRRSAEERMLSFQARCEARCRKEMEAELARVRTVERERIAMEEATKSRAQVQEIILRAEREAREREQKLRAKETAALERLRARELELEKKALQWRAEAQQSLEDGSKDHLVRSRKVEILEERCAMQARTLEKQELELKSREGRLEEQRTALSTELDARTRSIRAEIEASVAEERESIRQRELTLEREAVRREQEKERFGFMERRLANAETAASEAQSTLKQTEDRLAAKTREAEDSRRQIGILADAGQHGQLASDRLRSELDALQREVETLRAQRSVTQQADETRYQATVKAQTVAEARALALEQDSSRLQSELAQMRETLQRSRAEHDEVEDRVRRNLERAWDVERSGLLSETERLRRVCAATTANEQMMQSELRDAKEQLLKARRECSEELRLHGATRADSLRREREDDFKLEAAREASTPRASEEWLKAARDLEEELLQSPRMFGTPSRGGGVQRSAMSRRGGSQQARLLEETRKLESAIGAFARRTAPLSPKFGDELRESDGSPRWFIPDNFDADTFDFVDFGERAPAHGHGGIMSELDGALPCRMPGSSPRRSAVPGMAVNHGRARLGVRYGIGQDVEDATSVDINRPLRPVARDEPRDTQGLEANAVGSSARVQFAQEAGGSEAAKNSGLPNTSVSAQKDPVATIGAPTVVKGATAVVAVGEATVANVTPIPSTAAQHEWHPMFAQATISGPAKTESPRAEVSPDVEVNAGTGNTSVLTPTGNTISRRDHHEHIVAGSSDAMGALAPANVGKRGSVESDIADTSDELTKAAATVEATAFEAPIAETKGMAQTSCEGPEAKISSMAVPAVKLLATGAEAATSEAQPAATVVKVTTAAALVVKATGAEAATPESQPASTAAKVPTTAAVVVKAMGGNATAPEAQPTSTAVKVATPAAVVVKATDAEAATPEAQPASTAVNVTTTASVVARATGAEAMAPDAQPASAHMANAAVGNAPAAVKAIVATAKSAVLESEEEAQSMITSVVASAPVTKSAVAVAPIVVKATVARAMSSPPGGIEGARAPVVVKATVATAPVRVPGDDEETQACVTKPAAADETAQEVAEDVKIAKVTILDIGETEIAATTGAITPVVAKTAVAKAESTVQEGEHSQTSPPAAPPAPKAAQTLATAPVVVKATIVKATAVAPGAPPSSVAVTPVVAKAVVAVEPGAKAVAVKAKAVVPVSVDRSNEGTPKAAVAVAPVAVKAVVAQAVTGTPIAKAAVVKVVKAMPAGVKSQVTSPTPSSPDKSAAAAAPDHSVEAGSEVQLFRAESVTSLAAESVAPAEGVGPSAGPRPATVQSCEQSSSELSLPSLPMGTGSPRRTVPEQRASGVTIPVDEPASEVRSFRADSLNSMASETSDAPASGGGRAGGDSGAGVGYFSEPSSSGGSLPSLPMVGESVQGAGTQTRATNAPRSGESDDLAATSPVQSCSPPSAVNSPPRSPPPQSSPRLRARSASRSRSASPSVQRSVGSVAASDTAGAAGESSPLAPGSAENATESLGDEKSEDVGNRWERAFEEKMAQKRMNFASSAQNQPQNQPQDDTVEDGVESQFSVQQSDGGSDEEDAWA